MSNYKFKEQQKVLVFENYHAAITARFISHEGVNHYTVRYADGRRGYIIESDLKDVLNNQKLFTKTI